MNFQIQKNQLKIPNSDVCIAEIIVVIPVKGIL